MALRVALVGGPMYDGLYSMLPEGTEVVVHADHPTLNRAVADLLAGGTRIDLLSTHSKSRRRRHHGCSHSIPRSPMEWRIRRSICAPSKAHFCVSLATSTYE